MCLLTTNIFQGCFVFLFYIVLNKKVKNHWLKKMGLKEESQTTNSTTTKTATTTKSKTEMATFSKITEVNNTQDQVYENATLTDQ